MSAILGRMIVDGDHPRHEYLERNEALFSEQEWNWTTNRDAAWRFEFANYEAEVATIEQHVSEVDGRKIRPWAINLPRIAPRPCQPAAPAAPRGIAPAPASERTITERIHVAHSNRRVAAARREEISPARVFSESARRLGEHVQDDAD